MVLRRSVREMEAAMALWALKRSADLDGDTTASATVP